MKKKSYYRPRQKVDPIDLKFQHLILERYRFWTLLIHENQSYLGRAILWLNRPGKMQRFSELSVRELQEHQVVLKEYEKVLKKLWKPDHINYAWLGNHMHLHAGHGHMHVIPRYKSSRSIQQQKIIDHRWGKNYAPAPPLVEREGEVEYIRDTLIGKLSK